MKCQEFVSAGNVISFVVIYKQVINYNRGIKHSIKVGNYWDDDHITEKGIFSPEKGKKKIELGLFHFKRNMPFDVISHLNKLGYRSATLKELLAFGAKKSVVPRELTVIALGSVIKLGNIRFVPALRANDHVCMLHLRHFGTEWRGYDRFLTVRKVLNKLKSK